MNLRLPYECHKFMDQSRHPTIKITMLPPVSKRIHCQQHFFTQNRRDIRIPLECSFNLKYVYGHKHKLVMVGATHAHRRARKIFTLLKIHCVRALQLSREILDQFNLLTLSFLANAEAKVQ